MDSVPPEQSPQSQPPWLTWLLNRRLISLVAIAAAMAIVAYGAIEWAHEWDNPRTDSDNPIPIAARHFTYKGNPIDLSVSCICPQYFIEGHSHYVTFIFSLKLAPQQNSPRPAITQDSRSEPASRPKGSAPVVANLGAFMPEEWVSTWVDTNSSGLVFGSDNGWNLANANSLASGATERVPATFAPKAGGTLRIMLNLQGYNKSTQQWEEYFQPAALDWWPYVRAPFRTAIAPVIYSVLVFGVCVFAILFIDYRFRQVRIRAARQLEEAASHRDKSHFAWESARIKLEAYFDRNLIQVNLVFWLAVGVMLVGFGFVLAGVLLSLRSPGNFNAAALTSGAGIITQFVGATVMVIYRSTMGQANEFMSVLERINTVGMAVHELERIPDEPAEVKSRVRGRLVEALVAHGQAPKKAQEEKDKPEKVKPEKEEKDK